MKAAQADLAAFAEGAAGPLRVGTYQSVSTRLLPAIVRRFKEAFPKVEIELSESAIDDELEARVERGEVDLSFVMLPMREAPLDSAQLLVDPYVLLVPRSSPLAGRAKPPSLREIAKEPLIGYRQCRSMEGVETAIRRAGAEPRIVFRSDDNGTVQGLVGAGIGVALVPRLTLQPPDGTIEVVELGDLLPPRLVGIAWHRDRYRTPAARAFVETAQDLCAGDALSSPRPSLVRLVVVGCGADAGDDRFLRALLQPLAAALHRAEELVEVHLERREDAVRPVLHLEPRLASLAAGVVDDLLRLLLGELDDLGLRRFAHRLLARLLHDAVASRASPRRASPAAPSRSSAPA